MNTYFFKIQLRINNRSTFHKLANYSENIRNAIVNAKPCKSCPNSEGVFTGHSEYIFTYEGIEYRKCQAMCTNFVLRNLQVKDIESLIDIINRDILYSKSKAISNLK